MESGGKASRACSWVGRCGPIPCLPGSRSHSFALKRLSDRSFAACFRAESLSRTADGWFGVLVEESEIRKFRADVASKEKFRWRLSGCGVGRGPVGQEEALQLDVPVLLFGMCDLERLQQRPVLALGFAISTGPEGRVATVLDAHLRQELSELVGDELRTVVRSEAVRNSMPGANCVRRREMMTFDVVEWRMSTSK